MAGDSSSEDEGSPVERVGSPAYRAAAGYGDQQDDGMSETFVRAKQRIGGTLHVDKVHDFSDEVAEMRAHIRKMSSGVWTTARWLSHLDIAVGCCVLFVSIVSPVDVTMSRTPSLNTVTAIGLFCNGIFAIEVIVRLNRGYRETDSRGGGRWVRNRMMITKNYIKSWFVVDLVAAMPLDLPFVLGVLDVTQPGNAVRFIGLARIIRCFKVIHVLPIVMNFLTSRINMTHSSAELLKFAVMCWMCVHYLACLWAYVGLNWEPSDDYSAAFERSWIDAYGFENYAMYRLYAISLYVSIVAMFGGVSSVTPQNFAEYCTLCVMMLVGGLLWAYVLSMLCAIFSKLDPRETEHKNMMDELSYFMEDRDFDPDHKQRMRDFFTYTKDFGRESGYSAIFERMSNKLRADTALIMGEEHVQRVWYLSKSKCEIGFLCEVALNLKPALYEIHEPLPIKRLTVVSRGLVAQRMRLIGAGKVLGADCLLKEQHEGLRDLDPVMCLSYVHVACISRETLFSLAKDYPKAMTTLLMAGRHMTIRAALILYYRKFVRHARKLPGRGDMSDAASLAYDKKLGRASSKKLDANQDVSHYGESIAVEKQLNELKKMIASMAMAQGVSVGRSSSLGLRSARTRSGSGDEMSPSILRRMDSMERSRSRGGGNAKLLDKPRARQNSRSGTKEAPERAGGAGRRNSRPRSRNEHRSNELEA